MLKTKGKRKQKKVKSMLEFVKQVPNDATFEFETDFHLNQRLSKTKN